MLYFTYVYLEKIIFFKLKGGEADFKARGKANSIAGPFKK